MSTRFYIRDIENTERDMIAISRFMIDLAEFDGFDSKIDPHKLKAQLFDFKTNVRAFLAFRDNEPIGFILCYECFTVYHGERGLHVAGAYIVEKYRNVGYGVKLFQHASQYALDNGFEFMNWIVENENDNAYNIYQKMGANVSDGWSYVRVSKEIIIKAAQKYRRAAYHGTRD